MAGRVYLVGAGPGDPGLLTIKGRRCLEAATCVVYDYLANPRLLDFAPPEAERILAGKHGGGTKVSQEEIHRILIDRAQRGGVVVRLKGGDPFVFGRGGEEAQAIRAAGIPFEVVPGVTAAVAVPAYAGIPLTHRDFASAVTITTGFEHAEKGEPIVPWRDLARPNHTIVILMTARQLGANLERLREEGLDGDTPAAVIEWGTRADQRSVVATVATLAERATAAGIHPPALAVIGDVVRLSEQLDWFRTRPLFGRRIVVTRPRDQAPALAEALEAAGAEVVVFPTIEIAVRDDLAALDAALATAETYDWLLFTSANGVRVFFERLREQDRDIRAWHRTRIGAIGPQTARALAAFGVRVDLVPSDYTAEGLLAALDPISIADARILLPRAAGARDILPLELRRRGARVDEIATYESRLPVADAGALRAWFELGVDLVTFTSSSTAEHFARLLGDDLAALATRTRFGCIGPITAATARTHGLDVVVEPSSYTIEAFAAAIIEYFRNQPLRCTVPSL